MNGKPGEKNCYYVLDHKNLKPVMPVYSKVNARYKTNMVQKILLHPTKLGLLMVGLPNYNIIDIFLMTKPGLVELAKDKVLEALCHWTMVIDQKDDFVRIFLGTMSGIYRLQFKLH